MRLMGVLVLVAYFIASLFPDMLAIFLNDKNTQYLFSRETRQYLQYLNDVPWKPFVFAFSFGTVATLTSQHHNKVEKEELFAFVLIITLIFIIIQYGGGFAAPLLALAHIGLPEFAKIFSTLFIAIVVWKGLHIPLGGIGVFLTTALAAAMAFSGLFVALPISVDVFWFTVLGTFMGAFAAFSRA